MRRGVWGHKVLAVLLASPGAAFAAEFPQLEILPEKEFSKCLVAKGNEQLGETLEALQKDEAAADADSPSATTKEWKLKCSLKEFLETARSQVKKSIGVRYLVAKILHQEILRLRADTFLTTRSLQPTRNVLSPSLPLLPKQDFLYLRDFPIDLQSFENPHGLFLSQNESLIGEAYSWLEPLLSYAPLKAEAQLQWAEILGDSLRFTSLLQYLEKERWLEWPRWARNSMLYRLDAWISEFDDPQLKPWFQNKLELLRPASLVAGKAEDFFLWTRSFELQGAPRTKEDQEFRLEKLRDLQAAFPGTSYEKKVRELLSSWGLGTLYRPLRTEDLDAHELLLRAQAYVKLVDSDEALRVLNVLKAKPKGFKDDDEIWRALQIHVRVLRILDRRHEISAVIKDYLKIKNFLRLPAARNQAAAAADRAIEIAKFYWTYDSSERALEVLEQVIRYARSKKEEGARGQALYYKLRVLEQLSDKDKAFKTIEEALLAKVPADLYQDLLWRRFFLVLDRAEKSKNYLELTAALDKMRAAPNDTIEKGRIAYWKGRSFELNQRLEEAKVHFKDAYVADTFSYYSNLAGLELIKLGEKPDTWNLPHAKAGSAPDFGRFFDVKDGELKDPAYKDLARVYYLAQLGDVRAATRAYADLDRMLWPRVLSSQISEKERWQFGRAVAWLRLSQGDYVGSLRAGEALRQAFGERLESEDFYYLYPLGYWNEIQLHAKNQAIDPWFVASLIRQESAFNPAARSSANALGLMQMIPPVAKEEARLVGRKNFQINDLYRPPVAVQLGTAHLKRNWKSFNESWICAIASYNAGSPPVRRWQSYFPEISPLSFVERISYTETRNYVKSILRNYLNYQRVYAQGDVQPDFLFRLPTTTAKNSAE